MDFRMKTNKTNPKAQINTLPPAKSLRNPANPNLPFSASLVHYLCYLTLVSHYGKARSIGGYERIPSRTLHRWQQYNHRNHQLRLTICLGAGSLT